jgi:hypothetical protein
VLQSAPVGAGNESDFVAIDEPNPERAERFIAVVRPDVAHDERVTHALQLLSSMLWAFRGSTSTSWVSAPPEKADVVVVHGKERTTSGKLWQMRGKLVVEITTSADSSTASDGDVLVYPFRAEQVRSLLERLAGQLGVAAHPRAEMAPAGTFDSSDAWRFVESMRAMRAGDDAGRWLVARNESAVVLCLQSNAAGYVAEAATVSAIRSGALDLSALRIEPGVPPAGATPVRSGQELLWFAAYHASDRLAACLRGATTLRLSRWPNIAAIRPSSTQLRIIATLMADPQLNRISRRAQADEAQVVRTLNALAASNLITIPADTAVEGRREWRPDMRPRRGFAAFLRDVRKHLGLGALA